MNKGNKNIQKMLCPNCLQETSVIKHGFRNGVQRYKCKKCSKVFNDPSIKKTKYERNTKRVLTLLLNLLENNFFSKEELDKAIQSTDKTKELSVKVQFNTHFAEENKNKLTCKVGCSNPKLLICQDEKEITFIQLPTFDKNKCIKSINDTFIGKIDRTITLIDNETLGKSNKSYNKPYIK